MRGQISKEDVGVEETRHSLHPAWLRKRSFAITTASRDDIDGIRTIQ